MIESYSFSLKPFRWLFSTFVCTRLLIVGAPLPLLPRDEIFFDHQIVEDKKSEVSLRSNNLQPNVSQIDTNERQQPSSIRRLQDDEPEGLFIFNPRFPQEKSLFLWEATANEPYDTVFNETFSNLINDYNDETGCELSQWQSYTLLYMKKVIQFWSELARREKIPYSLAYGSLLGYARNKNYTPYVSLFSNDLLLS